MQREWGRRRAGLTLRSVQARSREDPGLPSGGLQSPGTMNTHTSGIVRDQSRAERGATWDKGGRAV